MQIPSSLKSTFHFLLLGLALISLLGCGKLTANNAQKPPPTIEEVYQRMKQAATREGYVLHVRKSTEAQTGRVAYPGRIDIWLDVPHDVARTSLWFRESGAQESVTVIAGANSYELSVGTSLFPTPAETCVDNQHALCSLLLRLPEDQRLTIDRAEYDGKPAIDLSAKGEVNMEGPYEFETHYYVDEQTFLPIAYVVEMVAEGEPATANTHSVMRFDDYEFIPAADLPPHFFDSGFAPGEFPPADPAAGLRGGTHFQPMWLGQDIAASGDLPALFLQAAALVGGQAFVYYDDERGELLSLFSLEEWQAGDWDSYVGLMGGLSGDNPAFWWQSPCTQQIDVPLPDGEATIFAGHVPPLGYAGPAGACPSGDPDLFIARVRLGETLVNIFPTAGWDSTWNSEEGMRRAISSLTPSPNDGPASTRSTTSQTLVSLWSAPCIRTPAWRRTAR